MERLFIFNCSQLDGCMHIFIYIYTQTHTHAQTYFVFKSSYLGFEEKKNIKNKLINKLKSWTIHSVGFRVDQTVSWWEEPDGSAVDQTGSRAPFTTTKAPQLSQSIRPPHPSLCISPHSLETMCVCVRIVPQWGLPRSDYRPVALFTSHPSQKLSRGEK